MSHRYEIRERIGQGGLGSVYKAYDNNLHREVAMKRVLTTGQGTLEEIKAAGDKLIAEAQTLSTLNHPNIVTVFDVGQDDAGGFVVMELLKGETLDETVERGVLTADDFKEVVFQTMEGLIAAHAKNVIHRDIKPTNIMLIWQASGRFQLKILDFGLAKFSKHPSVQTMDQEDAVMGSIFFMAPEQFERTELDVRTDLYQMGCVYYNSLTGQYPFNGETAPQVMAAHLQHKVVPLEQLRPDLPPALCQWVMWLINRDINSRPVNAKEALKYFPRDSQTAPTLPRQQPTRSTGPAPVQVVTAVPTVVSSPGPAPAVRIATGTHPPVTVSGSSTSHLKSNRPGAPVRPISEPKKGLSGTVITSIIAIAVMASAGLWVFLKKSATTARENRLEFLRQETAPVGIQKDVDILIRFMNDEYASADQKSSAYGALKKLKGEGIDATILNRIEKMPENSTRRNLATLISSRAYTPAFETLVKFSQSSKDERHMELYLRAAKPLATAKNTDSVLQGIKGGGGKFARIYEDMLISILRQSSDIESGLRPLREGVRDATGEEQRSLFRVLGIMGGAPTFTLLEQIFAGTNSTLQLNALAAFSAWPDRSPLPLVATLAISADKNIAISSQRVYTILSGKPGPVTIGQRIDDWKKGHQIYGSNVTEFQRLVQTTVDTPHPRTIAMLETWQEEPKVGPLVKAVITALKKKLTSMIVMAPGDPLEGRDGTIYGPDASISPFLGITGWNSPETYFTWHFKVKEGGEYKISVNQADLSDEPSDFIIYIGGKTFKGQSSQTASLEEFKEVSVPGTVTLAANEIYDLSLLAGEKIQPQMMDISSIVLTLSK